MKNKGFDSLFYREEKGTRLDFLSLEPTLRPQGGPRKIVEGKGAG